MADSHFAILNQSDVNSNLKKILRKKYFESNTDLAGWKFGKIEGSIAKTSDFVWNAKSSQELWRDKNNVGKD